MAVAGTLWLNLVWSGGVGGDGVWGVSSGELVLISTTLLRESYWFGNEGRVFEVLLYIVAELHTQGAQHLCGDIACILMHRDTLGGFSAYVLLSCMPSIPRVTHTHTHTYTRQQPSCAADLKQLPSQALSSFGQWGAHSCKRPCFDAAPPPSLLNTLSGSVG